MTNQLAAQTIKTAGLKATPQRIAVYKYLYEHRIHPSADEIYLALTESNPSFSKATVYNALDSLCQSSLAMRVTIDPKTVRYDADTSLHGHFVCECCGAVTDFNVKKILAGTVVGEVTQMDVYYSGICQKCLSRKNKKQ